MEIEEIIKEKHSGDEEQINFIFSNAKRIIVTAPAECGKTTAMVSKIAYMLSTEKIKSNKNILAMTFSVNAAMCIKDSVREILPSLISNSQQYLKKVDVANYHNFAMKLLFKYGYVLNTNLSHLNDFQILDDDAVCNQGLLISSDVSKLKKFGEVIKNVNYDDLIEKLDTYWNICEKLICQNVITYNGILVAAIKLLENDLIASFYKKYYQLIIIDEFQDTNLLGYLLINKLTGDNEIVFLGDDIQKIYGFLGAIDGALGIALEQFNAVEYKFKNNYRFKNNERMKRLDLFIRNYASEYKNLDIEATVLLKCLKGEKAEINFVTLGIEKIIDRNSSVAVLVRSGWQGKSIAESLENKGISFFNGLYAETDKAYLNFYKIAVSEYHECVHEKAVFRDLQKCLSRIKARENEVYSDDSKKYIFDSLYKLLEKLFEVSRSWEGTAKDKYINIDYHLGTKGLKHMMEYLDERVVLTTIHSSKGLEWDYVIIPQMSAHVFPPSKHVCKICQSLEGCNQGFSYCENLFVPDMKRKFEEEISVYYVALTRAKRDVFLTVNSGCNSYGYQNRQTCLINLPGLRKQDYSWDEVL